jgi:CheY-like chemotaxis protein
MWGAFVVTCSSPANPRQETRVRTLLVEDDDACRRTMSRILELLGYQVTGAATMAEGMAALGHAPDCMILDLMLPDGNGLGILRRIRQQNLAIRVAVLSGADAPLVAEARLFKPDAVFTKPVDVQRLLAWLAGS